MSYSNSMSSKKKKNKPKQSQSRSRTKLPRPNGSSPALNHSRSANSHKKANAKQPHSKHKKAYHNKTSTPPPVSHTNKMSIPKSSSLRKKRSKTPKPTKAPKSTTKVSKVTKASKSNSKSNAKPTKSSRPKPKPHKPHNNKTQTNSNKSAKARTASSPLRQRKAKGTNSPFQMKPIHSPKPLKQRTTSTPKPIKTKRRKNKKKPSSTKSANSAQTSSEVLPVLKQSHSSSTDISMFDRRQNLSPKSHKNSVKNGKKTAKKRSFYGDAYATKQKGKLQKLYKVKEKIGSGTFSTVRRGIRRGDKQEIAIKIITKTDLNDTEARLIKREIGVMEKLSNHQNIVKLYDIFETTHHLYLIIEYCKGGELFDELINCTPKGWFSERETSQIIRQIAEGLKFMHLKKIIHRDLKLENILVSMKKNYNINKKKKKFSMDDNSDSDDCKKSDKPRGHTAPFKKNKSDRGVISVLRADVSTSSQNEEDLYEDDSDDEGLAGFINRRHSDCISRIPPSILYGHGMNDHNGPESSIIVKISDFGLSKKLEIPQNNIDIIEEQKEEKKKKHKMHILSKRKKKKNQLNDREFAVMATNCGTLYYVAPEILNNAPYNEKVDMWSLGVICYVLLCGSLPFYSENELEISDLILKCKYDLGETDDHWLKVSDSAKDLIQKLLTLDKKNRLTANEVLTHPFITGQNKLLSTKRRSLKWSAGGLFAGKSLKWPMKFKNMLDSAKNISFHNDSSDIENNSNSDYEHIQPQPPPSPNKKVKYKIPFDSEHE